MTAPPYLTRAERDAVERVLRAAGWLPTDEGGGPAPRNGDVWWPKNDLPRSVIDLRELFPSPFPDCARCGGSGQIATSWGTPEMGGGSVGTCPDCHGRSRNYVVSADGEDRSTKGRTL